MQDIHIKFMVEKKDGFGEDSEPLSFSNDTMCAVGVFDGMGGSGASKGAVKGNNEEHSQAYFASRMAKDAVEHFLESTQDEITAATLKEAIMQQFDEKIVDREIKSMLRSSLLRPYPTTMALVVVESRKETNYSIKSFWAGDSRNYLWTDTDFCQISNDDLKGKKDPYENLKNDDVLSNCITATGRFDIKELCIEQTPPFIVISATDGCFGYLKAPMYFERIIKDALVKAEDKNGWVKEIKDKIQQIAADDISLSLWAVGCDDFKELKKRFGQYDDKFFKDIDNAFDELKTAEQKLHEMSKRYESLLTSYWKQYKSSYMKYFLSKEENCLDPKVVEGAGNKSMEGVTESENKEDQIFASTRYAI